MNTPVNATTKLVPYQILFGREPILPREVATTTTNSHTDIMSPREYARDVKMRIQLTTPVIKHHIEQNQD